jgi:fluoride ion exporter CrcB/FEX
MRIIILILLLSLAAGYYLTYHYISDTESQWYCYFVVNDLKAFLIALALMVVTYKKPSFIFAACAGLITFYDLLVQVLDVNQKGNWADLLYQVTLGLITALAIWKIAKNKNG